MSQAFWGGLVGGAVASTFGFLNGYYYAKRIWFRDGRCLATIRTVVGFCRCDRPRGNTHGPMHELRDGVTKWPG